MLAATWCAAVASTPWRRDEQRHQRERGDFDHHGQSRRHAQARVLADGVPVGPLHAPPDGVGTVQWLGAQQPQGAAQKQVVHQDRGPGAAHGAPGLEPQSAEGEPDGQRHLHEQRQRLQPGHQQRLAQALVEGAVHAKEQGRRQRQHQHAQVLANFALQRGGHLGPAQQVARKEQRPGAGQHRQQGQVQGLAHRTSQVLVAARGLARGDLPTPAGRAFALPCSSAQMGSRACKMPISATKTVMYTAEPTESAASACSE